MIYGEAFLWKLLRATVYIVYYVEVMKEEGANAKSHSNLVDIFLLYSSRFSFSPQNVR